MLSNTVCGGLKLYHAVERLGDGVAENVVNLIRLYAERASVRDLPPITLQGPAWRRPWGEISTFIPVSGNAGPSREEEKAGGFYTCLQLTMLDELPPQWRAHLHPQNVKGVIAHEMTHLRWQSLGHGPEFDARTLALLRGAKFPARGGWSKATLEIMRTARIEANKFWSVSEVTRRAKAAAVNPR